MGEEPSTLRRSSRIIQKGLSVKPVNSFKRSYEWVWPQECLDSADVDIPVTDAETRVFFAAIVRRDPTTIKNPSTTTSRLRVPNGKNGGAKKEDEEVFRIGDTVLVKTQHSSYPSVGVIVALWQPRVDTDSRLSGVDTGCDGGDSNIRKHKDDKWWAQVDNNPLPCIRVHWFILPSEFSKVRAPCDHAANEIYYSLDHTTIIPPTDILSRCTVSNDPKDASYLGDSNGDEHKFYCFYATDAKKDVFYALNWQLHREKAIYSERGEVVRLNAWTVVPRDEDICKVAPTRGNNKRRLYDDDEPAEDSDAETGTDDSNDDFRPTDASDSEDERLSHPHKRRRVSTAARARSAGPQIPQTPAERKAPSHPAAQPPTKPSASAAPAPAGATHQKPQITKDKDRATAPAEGINLVSLTAQIRVFKNDVSQRTMDLPPMNGQSRSLVHQIAGAFNLKTKSLGTKRNRYIQLIHSSTDTRIQEGRIASILARNGADVPFAPAHNQKSENGSCREGSKMDNTGGHGYDRHREGDVVGQKAAKIDERNVGFKLLQRMGWKEGERIGITGGLAAPLTVVVKNSRLGLGAVRRSW